MAGHVQAQIEINSRRWLARGVRTPVRAVIRKKPLVRAKSPNQARQDARQRVCKTGPAILTPRLDRTARAAYARLENP
jgi:hypothetical protein